MKNSFFVLLLWYISAAFHISQAQPFYLDPSFGTNGYVIPGYAVNDIAYDLALQADGKTLVVGFNSSDCFIARFLLDGSPDLSFANEGVRTFKFGINNNTAYCVTEQPDGKILVAGSSHSGAKMGAARFLPNGAFDPSFGTNGKIIISFSLDEKPVSDIAVQPDGKIILTGAVYVSTVGYESTVIRLLANGYPDPDFGDNGYTHISTMGPSTSVALQADGKILVGGFMSNNGVDGCAIARLLPDGAVDMLFGSDGIRAFYGSGCLDIKVDPTTQKIYGAGYRRYSSGIFSEKKDIILARLTTAGNLDVSFAGGVVSTDYSWVHANGMALQADGKIIVAGFQHQNSPFNFMVARYNSNGTLDGTFGSNGFFTAQINGLDEELHKVLVMPDGRIMAAGYYKNNSNSTDMVLFRLTNSGITSSTDMESLVSWQVFPNPVANILQIRVDAWDPTEKGLVSILDLSGKTLIQTALEGPEQQLSLENLPSGTYLLRCESKAGSTSRTLLKL